MKTNTSMNMTENNQKARKESTACNLRKIGFTNYNKKSRDRRP